MYKYQYNLFLKKVKESNKLEESMHVCISVLKIGRIVLHMQYIQFISYEIDWLFDIK